MKRLSLAGGGKTQGGVLRRVHAGDVTAYVRHISCVNRDNNQAAGIQVREGADELRLMSLPMSVDSKAAPAGLFWLTRRP